NYLGDIITEIRPEEIEDYKRANIIVRNTKLHVPYNSKTDSFETLSQILIHDTARNRLIVDDVSAELNQGKKAVIITERKEHIDRKSTRLNSSHVKISYAVFCLKKKKKKSLHTSHLFFFNSSPPTKIYTLSLHDALPI